MSPAAAFPTEIGLQPLWLEDVDVFIALDGDGTSDNFKQAVTGVTLTPATSTQTLKTLSPKGVFTHVGAPTWSASIAYQQDWETPGSLALYLFENQGTAATLYFVPRHGGPAFTAKTPALQSGPIGGAGVDTAAAATVTLGIDGKPSRLTADALAELYVETPAP